LRHVPQTLQAERLIRGAPAPAADPVIPNPVFSNVFNPNVDTPVSTAPAAKEDDSNEDDGDYFNDLLSILNKRS